MITTIGEIIEQGEIELATMKRRDGIAEGGSMYPIFRRIALRLALEELQGAVNGGIVATETQIDCSSLPHCLKLLVADNALTDAHRFALGDAIRALTERLVAEATPAK